MAFVWLLSCFTLIRVSSGSGAPANEPELSIMPRIINGKDARPGSWPWHVAIQTEDGEIICGGSLIDRFWVMTAAHCNIWLSDKVITGLFDQSSSLDKIQVLSIDKIFLHPKYDWASSFGDIALLKLSSPAHLHKTVSPALLPSSAEEVSVRTGCVIMGWGYTHPEDFREPLKLQQATVDVISNAECNEYWDNSLGHTLICAGAKDISSYIGDSGGPLVCPRDEVWKVVGIASYVYKHNPTKKPIVFTRVASFIPWIDEIMAQNSP